MGHPFFLQIERARPGPPAEIDGRNQLMGAASRAASSGSMAVAVHWSALVDDFRTFLLSGQKPA